MDELATYTDWLTSLNGSDITALYAFIYPTHNQNSVEMSMEDSLAVFENMKNLVPTTFHADDNPNPTTGGAWNIFVHTDDGIVNIAYSGGFLSVHMDGQENIWIFNAEENPELAGYADVIKTLLANATNTIATEIQLTYKGNNVDAFYAIDTQNLVMAEAYSQSILSQLETFTLDTDVTNNYGYLIFVNGEKEYIYLSDNDDDVALTKSSLASIINSPLHPSWLIHMTPQRIVSATINEGSGNPVTITDTDTLIYLSSFLKGNVIVNAQTRIIDGYANPDAPASAYDLRLEFDSGVYYQIYGDASTDSFSLYTSDLDKSVYYTFAEGVAPVFIDYINSIK